MRGTGQMQGGPGPAAAVLLTARTDCGDNCRASAQSPGLPLSSPGPDAILDRMSIRLFLSRMLPFLPLPVLFLTGLVGPVVLHAGEEDAIGRLNTSGHHAIEMCTATLIAPALILTAAHCVTRPEDGYVKRVQDMVFVAGWDGEAHTGASRIKRVQVHPQAYVDGRFDLRHDLALAELTTPLTPAPMAFGNGTLPGPLTLMGYMRSRPHRLTVTPYCYGAPASSLWRIGCRVEPGQSGGPVIEGDGKARRVVAVIVAVTEEQALAVPVDRWLRQQFAASR